MVEFTVDREKCDWKASVAKYKGKILTEEDYDIVCASDKSFRVLGPEAGLWGQREELAIVVKGVYNDETEIYDVLKNIKLTSDLRTTQSGPVNKNLLEEKGLVEGEDYKLINENSYIRKSKSGKWQDVERGNEIHSGMIGYKKNRWTGENTITPWCDNNPDEWNVLKDIAHINEEIFAKHLPATHDYQKEWVKAYIKPTDRIGKKEESSIFTTLSINKYHKDYSVNGMGAHVDPGDVQGGRTTMAVFGEGEIEGAYFVFPRWGIAVKREHGDVVIADSHEIHGVTPITGGDGSMITCVAYSDSRLKKK